MTTATDMEQFVAEIENYASAVGRSPEWVLRQAIKAGWGVWARWKSGESSPTMANADRVRAWMAANPPQIAVAREAAE